MTTSRRAISAVMNAHNDQGETMPTPPCRNSAGRLAAAAAALEATLWRPGVTEDDLTPEHRELIQALAAYNSEIEAAGYPPPWHEPPTAAEWYEPEGAQP